MESTEKFEKLISRRDNLLKQNLNKQVRLAKISLKKDINEDKKSKNQIRKSPVSNKPEKPYSGNNLVSVAPKILEKEKEINFEVAEKLNSEKENNATAKEKNIPEKKGLFRKAFWRKNKKTLPAKISEKTEKEKNHPRQKIISKPKGIIPSKEVLRKEMEIDLKISKEADKNLGKEEIEKKDIKKLRRKTTEENVKHEIIKNSVKHVSHLAGEVKEIARIISDLRREVSKAVVGQEEVISAFICAILCDGHVLLEGVPGVAKTLIVKTLAEASGCSSNRIQFTVDLLPSDILGITTYTPQKGFETIKGPIFSNFIVADEINRSPPKTQSAMIESMQEKQVTIGKETFKLPLPFFVMANNNPLEQSGVYDLPEAQVDRFLFKLLIGYPKNEEEVKIMEENMTTKKFESFGVKPVLSPQKIINMQNITKEIYVDGRVREYIVKIIDKTRKKDFENGQYIEWGGSPRASIGLFIAAKAWALMNGRAYVVPKDVKDIAHFVLRHRIILNYRAKAEKLNSDKIIDEILDMIEV